MLVAFILDTSASMNQRVAGGLTALDCAKSAIEHFLKVRSRDAASRNDRYVLVTCEDGPGAIKAFDKWPFARFTKEVKAALARDMSLLGPALKRAFDLLNLLRLVSGIETYGVGRNPCTNEPAVLLLLTDGTELTATGGVTEGLSLPMAPLPGGDLTVQPFRWDQRLLTLILRMGVIGASAERPITVAGNIAGGLGVYPVADSGLSAMCEVTGGKCMAVNNLKHLLQSVEGIATRLQPCVVVNFERLPAPAGATPSAAALAGLSNSSNANALPPQVVAACQHKLLFARSGTTAGFWPIPEAYWPDQTMQSLPPRDAQPTLGYTAVDSDPFIPPNFPFDKYEVESSPLLGFLLSAKQGTCWQLFIANSKGDGQPGDPFGFIRLNRAGNAVNLYVLPYNYPLATLPAPSKVAPPAAWRSDLERYCSGIPPYYCNLLRIAMKRVGVPPHMVPDSRAPVSHAVAAHLERARGLAKVELDRVHSMLEGTAPPAPSSQPLPVKPSPQQDAAPVERPATPRPWQMQSTTEAGVNRPGSATNRAEILGSAHPNAASVSQPAIASVADAFEIPRSRLLRSVELYEKRLQATTAASGSLVSSLQSRVSARLLAEIEDDARRCVPIAQMGDYHEALLKRQMPRDPFMDEDERGWMKPMFGNPYKLDKPQNQVPVMAVDEAGDAADEGLNNVGHLSPRNRGLHMSKRRRMSESQKALPHAGTPESAPPAATRDGKVAGPSAMDAGSKAGKTLDNADAHPQPMVFGLDNHASLTKDVYRQSISERGAGQLLEILRAIRRHGTDYNMVFKLLAAPGLPTEKPRFVQALILQAKRHNKPALAERLAEYLAAPS
eukprot:jgi/Chlat1/2215/Chrsp17S02775